MPDERIAEFAGGVSGTVRGRAVSGAATVRLGERGLAIVVERGELRLPYGRLDGWVVEGDAVSVRITGGDAVAIVPSGGALALAEALGAHACVLPELTRGLRTLGSSRARADSAQGALFAPLISARRRAARMRDPARRIRALDAEELRTELAAALSGMVSGRVRQPGPERRALVAALEDAVLPLRAAIATLGTAAEAHARTPEPRRLAAWREWTEAARRAFAAADACWPAVRAALEGAEQPASLWRRWTWSGP
jgi:hypothetical protein